MAEVRLPLSSIELNLSIPMPIFHTCLAHEMCGVEAAQNILQGALIQEPDAIVYALKPMHLESCQCLFCCICQDGLTAGIGESRSNQQDSLLLGDSIPCSFFPSVNDLTPGTAEG